MMRLNCINPCRKLFIICPLPHLWIYFTPVKLGNFQFSIVPRFSSPHANPLNFFFFQTLQSPFYWLSCSLLTALSLGVTSWNIHELPKIRLGLLVFYKALDYHHCSPFHLAFIIVFHFLFCPQLNACQQQVLNKFPLNKWILNSQVFILSLSPYPHLHQNSISFPGTIPQLSNSI